MWTLRRECVELYCTLMQVIATATEPREVVQMRTEWETLCSEYPTPNAECRQAIDAYCRKWRLYDANGVIPTALFALRLEGKVDLREADFRVWRFESLPKPELPFSVWVDPRIETKDEFLQRVRATLRVEREPQLLERIEELPAPPVVLMEWNASRGDFEPKPAGWLQRVREAWNLHFVPDGTLSEMILAVCDSYYAAIARQVGEYRPTGIRLRGDTPAPLNRRKRSELYYRELGWVHILKNICGWDWKRTTAWMLQRGITEDDDFKRAMQRLWKLHSRLKQEFGLREFSE